MVFLHRIASVYNHESSSSTSVLTFDNQVYFGVTETEKVVEEKHFSPVFSSFLIATVSSLLPSHFRIQEKHMKKKSGTEVEQVNVTWMQR